MTDSVEIDLNEPAANEARKYPNNYIRTAKYTLWTFLPLNLFEQFHRFANLYFLLNALLSLWSTISPVSPVTSVSPLVFVLTVSAIKSAVEDYQRHKEDKRANSQLYSVIRNGVEEQLPSADIVVGDMIRIVRDEAFPSDVVVLCSSEEENVCYVDTANLDGENNLKRRFAPLFDKCPTKKNIGTVKGKISCEQSTLNLYKFIGNLEIGGAAVSLSHDQLLLRSSILRNTAWVYGIVVYAGVDTKMFKNLKMGKVKISTMEKKLNNLVAGVFVLNAVVVILAAIFSGAYHARLGGHNYLDGIKDDPTMEVAGLALFTYFILFTYLIPISLFVTIEVVRVFQAIFMFIDGELAVDPESLLETGLRPRNSNMNEDLGLIEHIFSDKTGTLTQNVMVLKQYSIASELFTHLPDVREALAAAPGGGSAVTDLGSDSERGTAVGTFLRAVALCNTVMPQRGEDGILSYKAESPDEAALVDAASECGVEMLARSGRNLQISVLGVDEVYEMMAYLEFTPDRKRMSVLVRFPDESVHLIMKGADNKVLERLGEMSDGKLQKRTMKHLDAAAMEGLRTLVFAERLLSEKEATRWMELYKEAGLSINDREEKIAAACDEVEKDMMLLGATAVEDKLQDEVPETIQFMLRAGVHVWMLTGDKQETAENIGFSSSLLNAQHEILRVNASTTEECGELLKGYLAAHGNRKTNARPLALVVDGYSLAFCIADYPGEFVDLGEMCESVICCRVNPLQKADVVGMVRKRLDRLSLAIGDGANDVSMIQEAHVGIGIVGKEGTQAARSSDYAMHEFRFLKRLLVVHGRFNYIRLAGVIQFSFYKNMAFIMPQFLFGFYSAFSGQVFYNDVLMATFNIFWASLPPFAIGIWERDVSQAAAMEWPDLYSELKTLPVFNKSSIAPWLITAVYHALIVYFFCLGSFGNGQVFGDASSGGHWVMSGVAFVCIVSTVLWRAGLFVKNWNPFLAFALVFSWIACFCGVLLYSNMPITGLNARFYNVGVRMMGTAHFWATLVLVLAANILPVVAFEYLREQLHPTLAAELRRIDAAGLPLPRAPSPPAGKSGSDASNSSGLSYDESTYTGGATRSGAVTTDDGTELQDMSSRRAS